MLDLVNSSKGIKVIVTDVNGRILVTSDRGGDISLVSFKYVFDDEDPDECTIKLQTADPLALDKINIGRSSQLQVTWWYVSGPMTYTSTVVIRDLKTKYGRNTINTELICNDPVYKAQVSRSKDVGEANVVAFLEAQFSDKFDIVMRYRSDIIFQIPRINLDKSPKRDSDTDPHLYIFPNESQDPYYKADEILDKIVNLDYLNPKIAPDGFDDPWGVEPDHPVRAWLENPRGIVSANRSQLTVLRDILKECPEGPWYVTGHGNTLQIHNRNFIDTPVRVYRYQDEPSKLLDFQATTKYDQFEKNRITHEFFDPSKAKFHFIDAYIDELFSMSTFKEKFNSQYLSHDAFEIWLNDWVDLMKAYEKWHVTRSVVTIEDQSTGELRNLRVANSPAIWGAAVREEAVKTDVVNQKHPYLRGPNGFAKYHDVILSGFIYTRPLQFIDDRSNFIDNEIRKMEMEKEEAKVIIEGDPFLTCNMRIQVENVHWQHRGLYYIKKCTHDLAKPGYKTTMECIKVISTSRVRTSDRTHKLKEVDGVLVPFEEDQYAVEKKLFGDPIKIETYSKARPLSSAESGLAGTTGWSRPTSATKIISTVEEELSKDNFIETILELRRNKTSRVIPNVEDN
jgi:hypothetical protein